MTGEVSLLGFGVGVELRSCFNKAFWVCVSGCCPADISVAFNTTEGFKDSDDSAEDNREEEFATRVGTTAPCRELVVAKEAEGPVLTSPEDRAGPPTELSGALPLAVLPMKPVLTLVTRDTMEEQTLATVVRGCFRTSVPVPWKGREAADIASEAAEEALIVAVVVCAMADIKGGP